MKQFPIHPGQYLSEEIEARDMTISEAARIISVPPNRLSSIIGGKRAISADTALRLSRWLGTSPDMWMTLQSFYDLAITEEAIADELNEIQKAEL